jgi:magnesium transporter
MNESSASTPSDSRVADAKGMVINCAAYSSGRRVADIDLDAARNVDTSDGRFVWIGLHEPNEPLLRTVQQRFGLHDLAIEDALTAHQRPKLEIYGDSLFIVMRTASLRDCKIQCGETHIFAGRGYVVTVRHGSTTAYREVRARCEGAPKMLAMGEGFVVYSIMDFIVDNYFPILQELEIEVDALEDSVFARGSDRPNVERIYELRHELLLLRRAVQPLQEVCNRIMRFDVPLIDQAMHPYLRDVQDHVIRLVESIDNLRDLLAAALEAHLLLSSVEQNNIIKIFSVAAVVLMPPTLVASIYGMNFKSMPELEWPYGYYVALMLMMVVAVLPYLFFKWKKWL